jgi:uncharacterized protein
MHQTVLKYKTVLFYAFTFAISWSAWFLMSRIYAGGQPGPLVYVFSTLGGLGPLAALALLDRLSRHAVSVRQVLFQVRIRNGEVVWFVAAVFALPSITILGSIGYVLVGAEPTFRLFKTGPDALGAAVVPAILAHFAASLVTSPLFEEPGWRGFALGELQGRFGREVGSLIVGVLWWLWHQPMNLTFGLHPSLYSAVWMVALSFLIDSLFNLSGRNLFAAMLAHQSSGTVIAFFHQGTDNLLRLG